MVRSRYTENALADLRIGLDFTVSVKADTAGNLAAELQQILQELGLGEAVRVE